MRPEQPNFSPWEPVPPEPLPQPPAPARTRPPRAGVGEAFLRGVGVAALTILMLVILGMLGALSVYAYFARDLPSPQELRARATPFKSTKIYDRNGKLLFEVFDPRGGRRTIVPIEEIPAVVIHATVATEDATFFINPGVNPFSIARSLYYNLRNGEVVFGGSTITQQLVKNVYLTGEKTLSRKVKEAILAAEITRRYSKEEILEIYLNEVFYGNLAYGIGAAAETYFGKQPADLTLAEAALLTGLIQSPALYDPYTNPEAALARRAIVLRLMHERGYIRQSELEAALRQPLGVVPRTVKMEAPHMVMYVREQLEKLYGTEMLYKGGLEVYTTLDLNMQRIAEEVARARIAALRDQNASNAALVAMDPQTGDVLAMLGSVDFNDRAIGGQVNVARMPRQPGSTIKPLTYLAAMERGMTAGTLVMDVAQDFPDGANPPYRPKNYDDKEYGPISVRTALACSRNIPAVATLQQIGLPALLEMARRLGIQSLNRPDYGLSLTLGGGEVTLLELTAAYAALANGGRRVTPRTILYIEDQEGRVIMPRTKPEMPQVLDPRRAYIITHILADDKARQPSFGTNNPMKLSFPAAAKTGTTNDYRDSWTEGYTPQLVTGVWVGNNDNKPMKQLSGARGAALIWHDFMERALAGQPHPDFARPAKIVELEVCPLSGHPRGETCPPPVKELFLSEEAPKDACPVHKKLSVCKISGKLATQFCPAGGVETRAFEDYGPQWDAWARQHNIATPPREACTLHTAPSKVAIEIPSGPLSGIVEVRGTTDVADFSHYVVEYGIGPNPIGWGRITPEISAPVFDGVLCRWDTSRLANGTYSLRVVVTDRHGSQYEAKAVTELRHITPTAPPTYTPLPSATPSPWPSITPSPLPSATPTLRLASPTPEPTDTAQPTATLPRPSATATAEPDVTPTPTVTASRPPAPTVTPWLPTRPPIPRPTFIIRPGYPEPVEPTRTRSPRRL